MEHALASQDDNASLLLGRKPVDVEQTDDATREIQQPVEQVLMGGMDLPTALGGDSNRPLTEEESSQVIADINRRKPDLVWVGLSTPKQEKFMELFHRELDAKVMIGVGAAFDFHTGRVSQAPRWMMRSGLEWFYRLCTEPRRLGPRYLRNNPMFIWHILLQQSGLRRYPLD